MRWWVIHYITKGRVAFVQVELKSIRLIQLRGVELQVRSEGVFPIGEASVLRIADI